MRRLHEGSRNNDMEKEQNKTTKSCNMDKHKTTKSCNTDKHCHFIAVFVLFGEHAE